MGIKTKSIQYPKSFAKKRYTGSKRLANAISLKSTSSNATISKLTEPTLVAASAPLDGSAPHYMDGPFFDPHVKLPLKAC